MLEGLEPALRPWAEYLVQLGQQHDPSLTITSVRRSSAEQARLYRRYLAGQSQFPAAPPGRSFHEYGRAWDMVGRPEVLRWLGAIWQSWGGTYGGEVDPIHFQA